MRRYYVAPCDDGSSIAGRKRGRSWDVMDRTCGRLMSNHDKRDDARREADQMNKENPHA